MKASFHVITLLAALSLAVTSCSHGGNGSSSNTAASSSSESNSLLGSAPAQQKKFCAVVAKYEPSLEESTNFVSNQMAPPRKRQFIAKMTANRAARKAELTSLLDGGNVDGWVGEVDSVRNATSHDLAVSFSVGCDAHLEAVALDSALTAQTVIPKSSPLYSVAKALKEGQRVTFSGHLIRKASLPDGYQELSVSDLPSLEEPRFDFEITKLAASR